MLINQVSQATGLTKKAIEYYTIEGLISPLVLENGYRDFSEKDIEVLNKISVLRKLDISVEEIKTILSDKSNTALQAISVRKELNLQRESAKNAILGKLSSGESYSKISEELQVIEKSKTITEKLLETFPGYWGRFICLHFARFLNEPVKTESQQAAYETIITFLDNTPPITLPEDLQEYLNEGTKDIGTEQIIEIVENTHRAMENPDAFLSEKKDVIEQYLAFKQSEDYKQSPAYRTMGLMKQFNSTSGYYDIFIPALKQLSSSYSEYCSQMEIANEKLLAQYPEIEKMTLPDKSNSPK
ncbi:MAG: MerR family transcriptional regulator [Ruminiclostridium sp.]|nr:MerR family transcriptional regulator [Ruminiclostridium sp.]